MKLKLDENLGPAAAEIFLQAGHDACLVREQGLGGTEDTRLAEVCRAEGRCLVTLDLDFSHVLNFPPSLYEGIAVLRLPEPATWPDLLAAARTLVQALDKREIRKKLWIVSTGQVREYWSEEDD